MTYSRPDACQSTAYPTESDNHQDCFKQQWIPEGGSLQTNWFNKYVVTEVDADPGVGTGVGGDGDPPRRTTYAYTSLGAGWRFPADPAQQRADESWTEWRGYSQVTVTHSSGTGQENAVVYWVLQGLDGDRNVIAPSGPSDYKSVTVHGSTAGPALSVTDSAWLAGKVYEESHRDDGGISQEYVVHNFGFAYDSAAYSGLPDARIVREDKTWTYQRLSTSTSDTATWREGETQSVYDSGQNASKLFGLPVAVENDGEIGVTDNSCIRYQYAFNIDPANSRWFALPEDTAHYSVTCPNTSSANQDGDSQTFYDSATTLAGNVPVDGNPTRTDTYTGASTYTTVKHGYDSGGRVLTVTDANNNVTTTSYSPTAGWPTSGITVTTPVPDVTAQDVYGQSSSKTAFTTTTIFAPTTGLPTSTVDANGQTATLQYDTVGRLTGVWRPVDGATSNPAGLLFSYTIPTGTSGSVPDSVTGPAMTTSQVRQSGSTYIAAYTYLDGLGQVREKQIPAGDGSAGRRVASVRYDSSGYTEGTSDPYYNSSAPGSGMVNPAVASLPAYHDLIVDWAGRTVESQLMNSGSAISAEDVLTAYQPDVTVVTPPVGPVTDTHLDIFGDTSSIVQHVSGGTPATITTSYSYDDMNQLAQITDNNNDVSTYTYNWAGQQTASHDPDAGDTSTQYDANGNVTSTTDASGQTLTTLYDTLNRPTTTWAGAAGIGTKLAFYTYDTATLGKNRAASSTSYNAGNAYTETVDGYDADGRSLGGKVTIPAAEGLLAGTYDTTTASYDAANHPLTVGYPAVGTGASALAAETVTTGYNNRGEPKTLTGTLGSTTYVSATSYLNWGPLSSRTYGTGTLTAQRSYGWNQITGWLTNITTTVTNAGTATTAQNDTYGYDKVGDVREVASTAGTAQQQCFSYDGLDRLAAAYTATTAAVPATIVANCGTAAANHSGGVAPYDLAYTYDVMGLGNLTTTVDNMTSPATTSTYNYPSFNTTTGLPVPGVAQPHTVTGVTRTGGASGTDSYGYNTNGAMNTRTIAGTASTLTWDPQQHLASVTSAGNTTSFVYDTAGNRLLRKSPTETVLYLPGQELHLAGTVITPTRYYTCGGSAVAQRVGGGGLTWLTGDNQNSAQITINTTTGNYTQQRYLPFGAQRGTQGPPTGSNRSYLGHNTDPTTALLQDGARYYDPALARFVSPDPIATPYDPQNLNAYSYAANNPTSNSDPSGLLRGSSMPCADGGDGVCAPSSGSIPTGGDAGGGPIPLPPVSMPPGGGGGGGNVDPCVTASNSEYCKVLTFTVSTINSEMRSSDFAAIKDELDPCMMKILDVCIPYVDDSNRVSGAAMWGRLVCTDCKWDQKPAIRSMLHMDLADLGSLMIDIPDTGKRLNYDIWANLIYGYVGTKAGFASPELHSVDYLPNLPIFGRSDKSDSLSVQIGIDLANAKGPLTTSELNSYVMAAVQNPIYTQERKYLDSI